MNLEAYSYIIVFIIGEVYFVVVGICTILILCGKGRFVLLILNGLIKKRNVNRQLKYFICGRELSGSDAPKCRFYIVSLMLIAICTVLFVLVVTVQISYECRNEPHLDCFKRKTETEKSLPERLYGTSPVNCSKILKTDIVSCYRIAAPSFARVFAALSATYLCYKLTKIILYIAAHIMLWIVDKCGCIGECISKILVFMLSYAPIIILEILRYNSKKYDYALQTTPIATSIYAGLAVSVGVAFVLLIPWSRFSDEPEYFSEVSLPADDRSEVQLWHF